MSKPSDKERPILFSGEMVRALLEGRKTQTRRVVKLPHENPLGQWEPTTLSGYLDKAMTKPAPAQAAIWHTRTGDVITCPYGAPGDRLWVRETWRLTGDWAELSIREATERAAYHVRPAAEKVAYRADGDDGVAPWTVSIHMPRWASRITLEVTGVRVERLQDISEADAVAEGCAADKPQVWWQGYREVESVGLIHQQHMGDAPPDWMIEPHKMNPTPWLERSAKRHYELLWNQINGPGSWETNPWVWIVEFNWLP